MGQDRSERNGAPSSRGLVALLDLRAAGPGAYEAGPRSAVRKHAFGGAVAAQALSAASRTVSQDREAHSVHCHFLRPGDTTAPTRFHVSRVRDGSAYTVRTVRAEQHGETTLSMTASFHAVEPGWSHQLQAIDAVVPNDMANPVDALDAERRARTWFARFSERHAFDLRFDGPMWQAIPSEVPQPPRLRLWLRSQDPLPEDQVTQHCALLYASDLLLSSVALMPHGVAFDSPQVVRASLDHAVWFHRSIPLDDWFLYDIESSWSAGGRALCTGRIFDREGRLAATATQEAMIRRPAPAPPP